MCSFVFQKDQPIHCRSLTEDSKASNLMYKHARRDMCVFMCTFCPVLCLYSAQHEGLGSLMHSLHNWDPVWKQVFSGRLLLPPAVSGSKPTGKCLPLLSLVNFRELPRRFPLFALSFTIQAPHTAGKYSEHQGKKWSGYEQWGMGKVNTDVQIPAL